MEVAPKFCTKPPIIGFGSTAPSVGGVDFVRRVVSRSPRTVLLISCSSDLIALIAGSVCAADVSMPESFMACLRKCLGDVGPCGPIATNLRQTVERLDSLPRCIGANLKTGPDR